ncbi:hypothetical protein CDAR_389011, partial [Caerostris darwini]
RFSNKCPITRACHLQKSPASRWLSVQTHLISNFRFLAPVALAIKAMQRQLHAWRRYQILVFPASRFIRNVQTLSWTESISSETESLGRAEKHHGFNSSSYVEKAPVSFSPSGQGSDHSMCGVGTKSFNSSSSIEEASVALAPSRQRNDNSMCADETTSWFVSCEQRLMRNVQTLSHGKSQQVERPSH